MKPPGIDYRTLIEYEQTMPFQQAVEKTLREWCPEAPKACYGGKGPDVARVLLVKKRKGAQ